MHLPTSFVAVTLLSMSLHIKPSVSQTTGSTTRYWDCCKPSCSWSKKATLASGSIPVSSCSKSDAPLANADAPSACASSSGTAYMCSNESPWAISSSLSYGYAAVNIAGGTEASWCCACYELTFTSGPVVGKKMIVQATNTGGDLGAGHFDLAIPGGGFGAFDACTSQYGTSSTLWGAQYGGISTRSQCDAFPAALKAGCYWRFDWFQNADNPAMTFTKIACPAALTAKTGCVRVDDSPTGPSSIATFSGTSSSTSTTAIKSSTSSTLTSTTKVSSLTTSRSTTATTTTTLRSATTTTAGGSIGLIPKWGQCGGNPWSGSTTCEAGSTCTYKNEFYSQCL